VNPVRRVLRRKRNSTRLFGASFELRVKANLLTGFDFNCTEMFE
jgi:hypothetical protein